MIPNTPDEFARQRALDTYRLVDSLPEAAYEDVVQIAATLCGAPVALVSLIDRDRQWFKARIGMDAGETTRDVAFCDHAIRQPNQLLEVPDARRDARFSDNPLVALSDGIRFYAGMPLVTPAGAPIGTVCVIDHVPRRLNDAQRAALEALSRVTMNLIEARHREQALTRAVSLHNAVPAGPATSAASAQPASVQAGYTVVIVELQGYAQVVTQGGDRNAEKLMQQLDGLFERCIRADAGDTINRATGSGEFIAVLQGEGLDAQVDALRRCADAFAREHRLQLLIGSAPATSPGEPPERVFVRADEALSRQKDALARQAQAA